MIFKEIRYLIYSPLHLIIDNDDISDVDIHDPAIDIYDYYEVIGITAWAFSEDEGAVVVSLKNTANKHFENYLENSTYNDDFICEQARGK